MDSFLLDIRLALRRCAAAPSRAIFAILTLSFGIAATTAMFAVVDAVLLRPLPFDNPETLRQIWRLQGTSRSQYLSPQSVQVWASQADIFTAVEPFRVRNVALLGSGDPELVAATEVGGGLLALLGVPPRLGRGIQPQDVAHNAAVVVLGDAVWRSRFASDPAVIGRSVRLDDRAYEIVGVMPSSFRFPREQQQLWIPLTNAPSRPVHAIARLHPGATGDLQVSLASIVYALERDLPTSSGWQIELSPLGGQRLDASQRSALFLLLGAVGFVMLIACANVSNLLLVEATSREREFGIRAAIGASRPRLLRLIVVETGALALAAGVLGTLLALWAVDFLAAYTPREFTFLSATPIVLDLRALGFATAMTVVAATLAGTLPAWRTASTPMQDALRSGARAATSPPRQEHLQRSFVIAQLAMTLMLLLAAGLIVRTFFFVTAVDPGFDSRNVVAMDISLPASKYPSRAAQVQFFDAVIEHIERIPGVVAVTATGGKPPTGGGVSDDLRFEIAGVGVALDDPFVLLSSADVRPEYFSTLRIPIVAGRTFSADNAIDGPSPVVINQALAVRLWRGDNPVGARVRFSPEGSWYTVLGVVGNVYQVEYDFPAGGFAAYFPDRSNRRPTAQETVIVRTAATPSAIIPQIRQAVWSVDADQPILKVATMERLYAEFLDVPRFQALLMTGFALAGLLIATIGLYGVLAGAIARRTREFGIRIALGATPWDVLRMALQQGAMMVGFGVALGVPGGFVVGRTMKSLLVGITPHDLVSYLVVIAGISATALVACWIPARRATRVDPISALRAE